jgi:hypothetical protein
MEIRIYLTLTLLVFVCSENKSFGQAITVKNSIVIINNKSSEKENYYKEAIYKANMEGYRLKETNDTLKFKEGFDCVLLSAKELSNKGITIDVNSYQEHFVYNYRKPEFSITDDGHLVATFIKISK